MRSTLKRLLLTVAPGPASALQRARQRRFVRRTEERLGLPRIANAFTAKQGRRVLAGPFTGMEYVEQSVGSALVPKLIGCYEEELHPVIERLIDAAPTRILDIGCAEGYYAIGLALRLPTTQVYAADTEPEARRLCTVMAALNNVSERVIVEGELKPQHLTHWVQPQTVIVCDCEGGEYSLLNPQIVPALRNADILVELHEVEGHSPKELLARFRGTHAIEQIDSRERRPERYPVLDFLPEEDRALAVGEFRPVGQQWAWMTAKAGE